MAHLCKSSPVRPAKRARRALRSVSPATIAVSAAVRARAQGVIGVVGEEDSIVQALLIAGGGQDLTVRRIVSGVEGEQSTYVARMKTALARISQGDAAGRVGRGDG